jgi:hypothetical protein
MVMERGAPVLKRSPNAIVPDVMHAVGVDVPIAFPRRRRRRRPVDAIPVRKGLEI